MKNQAIRTLVMCSVMAGSFMMFAQGPAQNIDPNKHPHLAAAQSHIAQAYKEADAAQQSNRDQLGDHAQKAKELLIQASQELKAAAEYANQHK
jgi:hypothetical protein